MTVNGTKGYERFTSRFIEVSQSLDFKTVCRDFIPYLPIEKGNALDIGAGAGQNAAALAELGFNVTAIEPMPVFLNAAKKTYKQKNINWLNDSLPAISSLQKKSEQFDFVLAEGVWHHLNERERETAAETIAQLTKPHGRCALSLRNGPAGMGTHVYPTDVETTIKQFNQYHFDCIFKTENQNSILPNKEDVKWTRVVLQKNKNI